ncbi:hypothetical protein LXA43DRAFT_1097890 [Ganoderma leucocontextum]|nr:hypothetical protein LXA43DRAFT_1097890 [Ganoderma leucocontextum]
MVDDAHAKVMAMAEEIRSAYLRHSTKYYYQLIMQDLEMEQRNADVVGDRKHLSQDQVTQKIAAVWRAMSEEEQIATTEECMKEIANRRSTRNCKAIMTPIQVFNDNHATTKSVEDELKALNVRTGRNTLLLMTSPGTMEFGQPYAFYTNEQIADFIMLLAKCTVPTLAIKMEGYCISGVQGLKQNYKKTMVTLKTEASNIINAKLSEISGGRLQQVKYKNFDRHVTEQTGIIIEQ